jgi:hypothetical protein
MVGARVDPLGLNLALASGGDHSASMGPSPQHRLRALLLALLLALGMSLSLVHASLMAAEMAVSAGAAQPCTDGCEGCGDGEGDLDTGTCLSLCGAAAQGLPPAQALALPTASRANLEAIRSILGTHSHGPDPGPPRPLTPV